MKSQKIAIVGAGFSGLTLAWKLQKAGFEIEIFEAQDRPGGLIQSYHKPILVEAAAHAFLASQDIEALFQELEIPFVLAGFRSKAKWIFRDRPRKWTLSMMESLKALVPLAWARLTGQHWPKPQETVANWTLRLSRVELADYVASPGLQGIYGAQGEQLSASLILGAVFSKELRPLRGQYQGSLAPRDGMAELTIRLAEKLKSLGVRIHYQRNENLENLKTQFDAVVVATSINQAAEFLVNSTPIAAERLGRIPRVSLSTVTVGYPKKSSSRVQGFGCLFPNKENFQSLGVLFNTDLFENRGPLESETWIFKDDLAGLSDSEVSEKIKRDRERLVSERSDFEFQQVIRWPKVLPIYGLELESFLQSGLFQLRASALKVPSLKVVQQGARLQESIYPLYLTGNYLGAIGLTKILAYNERLSRRIQDELGRSRGEP